MKKFLAIAMVLLALAALFVDWVKYESIKAPLEGAFGELEKIVISQEGAGFQVDEANELITRLDTGASPYDISAFAGFYGKHALRMPSRADELLALGIASLSVQIFFWLMVALMVKLMVQHLFGRRPRGVGTTLLLLLFYFAPMCFFVLFTNIYEDAWPALPVFTPAIFVAAASMIGSCIVWHIQLQTDGAEKGKWSLQSYKKCAGCGAAQESTGNMFCIQCGAAMDGD